MKGKLALYLCDPFFRKMTQRVMFEENDCSPKGSDWISKLKLANESPHLGLEAQKVSAL